MQQHSSSTSFKRRSISYRSARERAIGQTTYEACTSGNFESLGQLLDKGVDVNRTFSYCLPPEAVDTCKHPNLPIYIQRYANSQMVMTMMLLAIVYNEDLVKWLLEIYRANPEGFIGKIYGHKSELSYLHIAIRMGRLTSVSYLIRFGADIAKVYETDDKETALSLIFSMMENSYDNGIEFNRHINILKTLANHGHCDVRIQEELKITCQLIRAIIDPKIFSKSQTKSMTVYWIETLKSLDNIRSTHTKQSRYSIQADPLMLTKMQLPHLAVVLDRQRFIRIILKHSYKFFDTFYTAIRYKKIDIIKLCLETNRYINWDPRLREEINSISRLCCSTNDGIDILKMMVAKYNFPCEAVTVLQFLECPKMFKSCLNFFLHNNKINVQDMNQLIVKFCSQPKEVHSTYCPMIKAMIVRGGVLDIEYGADSPPHDCQQFSVCRIVKHIKMMCLHKPVAWVVERFRNILPTLLKHPQSIEAMQREVDELKHTFIANCQRVSLRDFMILDKIRATRYADNVELARIYEDGDWSFKTRFPIFGGLLDRTYNKCRKHAKSFNRACSHLKVILNNQLPTEVVGIILDHFSVSELKILE